MNSELLISQLSALDHHLLLRSSTLTFPLLLNPIQQINLIMALQESFNRPQIHLSDWFKVTLIILSAAGCTGNVTREHDGPARATTDGGVVQVERIAIKPQRHIVEVRVGFLVGRQRPLNETVKSQPLYSGRLQRILTMVFEYALDKVNGDLANQTETTHLDASETSATRSGNESDSVQVELRPIIVETFGSEQESVRQTMELILKHRVHAILGPAQERCQLESMIAGVFNVPMVSYHCSSRGPFESMTISRDQVDGANDDCGAHRNTVTQLDRRQSVTTSSEGHWQQFAAIQATIGQAKSTLIETKPPSWKIVGRVIALVRRLLDLNNCYPQQLVLLYFDNEPQPTLSLRSNTNQTMSRGESTVRSPEGHRATYQREAHEHLAKSPQTATSEQYKTIGRLLELKLVQLLRGRPRAVTEVGRERIRTNQRAVEQSTLTVLNWHTTYHSGYTKNPFRRLIRRHLLRLASGRADYRFDSGDNDDDDQSRQQCDVPDRFKGAAGQSNKSSQTATRRPSSDSIYIVVGHYFEHLGLMQALDELGRLAFDDWPVRMPESFVERVDKERPEFVNDEGDGGGGQSARSESTRPANEPQQRDSGGRAPEQQRHRWDRTTSGARSEDQKRRPSVVIGVDIEPHDDERDDSVPFLHGLLMDAKGSLGSVGLGSRNVAGSASTIAASGAGANEPEINQAFGDINSPGSMYNHYIGVAPTKPSKSIELLAQVRHFHNRTAQQRQQSSDASNDTPTTGDAPQASHQLGGSGRQSSGAKINQTSVHDGHLDHLTLKLALLPIEAHYLYDSIVLLAEYFSGCLRASAATSADLCSRGERVVDWFANRHYSSYVADGPSAATGEGAGQMESQFDAQARAEGLYSLMARRVPLTPAKVPVLTEAEQQHDGTLWASSAADEFDIATVGQFVTKCTAAPKARLRPIEFSATLSSISKVWWPLWCDALEFDSGPVGPSRNWFESVCNPLLEHAKAGGNQSLNEPLEEGHDAQGTLSLRSLISLALFVCFLIAGGLITSALYCAPPSATRLGANMFYLNCLSRGERSIEWENSAWFSERDAENFLQIVNNLLLPSSTGDENDTGDEDDDGGGGDGGSSHETTGGDIGKTFGGELSPAAGGDLEQSTASGLSCLGWRPLKRQRQAEDEVSMSQRDSQRCHHNSGELSSEPHPLTLAAAAMAMTSQAIDLHCYMFPFPSCKFVHWLAALHTLKEMLFKHQSNMGGDANNIAPAAPSAPVRGRPRSSSGDGSFSMPCWRTRSRLMFQLPILFQRQTPPSSAASGKSLHGNDNRRCHSPSAHANLEQSLAHSDKCPCRRRRGSIQSRLGRINSKEAGSWSGETHSNSSHAKLSHLNRTFFTGRHKGSSTVRLLLSKYKTTNEHLCHLSKLNHPTIVKLFAISLTNAPTGGGNKLVQMIAEATGRGNLRQELALLETNRHINSEAGLGFRPILWRNWLIDLTNGLEYLHDQSPIGFHGRLCATTCLVTNNWRLKLSGFHVDYMRRSLGGYKLKQTPNSCEVEQQSDAYAAPELLAARDESRSQLLTGPAMKLADVYSFAFVVYELLVGQEPWTCSACGQLNDGPSPLAESAATLPAESVQAPTESNGAKGVRQRNLRLLTERVKVDPSFRPPIARLDKIVPILRRAFECAGASNLENVAPGSSLHQCTLRRLQPPHSAANGAIAGYGDGLDGGSLLMDYDGNLKSEQVRASLLSVLQATRSLVDSCWAQSPRVRPQSVAHARRLLSAGLLKSLSRLASLRTRRQQRPSPIWFGTKLSETTDQDTTLALYTKLVEAASRERLDALEQQMRISRELELALLPKSIADSVSGRLRSADRVCQRHMAMASSEKLSLCMFRIIMVPKGNCDGQLQNQRFELNQFEVLNKLLVRLDELVSSFRGHVNIWDSQVDSLMRFVVCAGNLSLSSDLTTVQGERKLTDPTNESKHRRISLTTFNHTRLVTTFALELIDLVNRLQTKTDLFLQLKCALHEGPLSGGVILPHDGIARPDHKLNAFGNRTRTDSIKLARFVLLGQTLQMLDALEQTCQPQKIQISSEMRAKLLELPEERDLVTVADDKEAFSLRLIPALLRGSPVQDDPLLQQQQGYIIMKRTNKIRARNSDLDTYWLLNGPRVTSSQRLMLPQL